jgi:hypothetical protein
VTDQPRRGGYVRVSDLLDAERRLDEALDARDGFARDPAQWSGWESVTDDGRRRLNLTAAHFERADQLQRRVEVAERELVAVRAAFIRSAGV